MVNVLIVVKGLKLFTQPKDVDFSPQEDTERQTLHPHIPK